MKHAYALDIVSLCKIATDIHKCLLNLTIKVTSITFKYDELITFNKNRNIYN